MHFCHKKDTTGRYQIIFFSDSKAVVLRKKVFIYLLKLEELKGQNIRISSAFENPPTFTVGPKSIPNQM